MSRGVGSVQRVILRLIADNPDQAFGTKAIAARVYPTPWPSKPQRFAVLRALRTIKLPGTWTIAPAGSGRHEMVLFDPGNADSAREKTAIDRDVAKERRALKLAKARLLVIQADIAEQQARRESVLAAAFEDAIEEATEEAASAKLTAAPSDASGFTLL